MREMLKKAAVFLLTAVMLMAMFTPLTVMAAKSGTCGDNLTWTLDDEGTLTISGIGDMWDWESEYGVPWYPYKNSIKKVAIQYGVTSIGECAFELCGNLTTIAVPESITKIGFGAFVLCTKLKSIIIPQSVTSIGRNAFQDCVSLENVTIKKNSKLKSIGGLAFYDCFKLESVNIPESVTTIGDGAFFNCDSLKNIVLEKNSKLDSIGNEAFAGCYRLETLNFEEASKLERIGDGAFRNCESLKIVDLGKNLNLKSIGDEAFAYCKTLASVIIPEGIKTISGNMFYDCWRLRNITIPGSVTSIKDPVTLADCSQITDIYYSGTKEMWNNIHPNLDFEFLQYVRIHYNSRITDSPAHSNNEEQILQQLGIKTETLIQNISCSTHSIKGPSITVFDKTFYLFEIEGKLELDFEGLPISVCVDCDKKTVKILFGFKELEGQVDMSQAANKSSYWSESYKDMKDLYTKLTNKKIDTTKPWNDYSSLRGKLKKMKAGLFLDVDCTIGGYMELSYETGKVKLSEGGFAVEADLGAELSAGKVLYGAVGIHGYIDGSLGVKFENAVSIEGNISITPGIHVGAGTKAFSKK